MGNQPIYSQFQPMPSSSKNETIGSSRGIVGYAGSAELQATERRQSLRLFGVELQTNGYSFGDVLIVVRRGWGWSPTRTGEARTAAPRLGHD
jgi:hypothetical protein